MNRLTEIKIIPGNWNNGEFKYNVQLWYNDVYAGHGRFVRSYEEAKQYITSVLKGDNYENDI